MTNTYVDFGNRIRYHETPNDLYEVLAARFGEQSASDPDSDTRWVEIGAGKYTLTFFKVRS